MVTLLLKVHKERVIFFQVREGDTDAFGSVCVCVRGGRSGIYLDDLLNIDNSYRKGMVYRTYPNEFNSTKIYDKHDDFDFTM